jgi:hypothetical protein
MRNRQRHSFYGWVWPFIPSESPAVGPFVVARSVCDHSPNAHPRLCLPPSDGSRPAHCQRSFPRCPADRVVSRAPRASHLAAIIRRSRRVGGPSPGSWRGWETRLPGGLLVSRYHSRPAGFSTESMAKEYRRSVPVRGLTRRGSCPWFIRKRPKTTAAHGFD